MQERKNSFLARISLTWKMLATTFLCGALVWLALDHVQQQRLGRILHEQQDNRLQNEAKTARRYFDDYILSFSRAPKLFLTFRQFSDYFQQTSWDSQRFSIKTHDSIPPWLPDASVLRTFAQIHYALLLDEQGAVREIYQAVSEPPPQPLLKQDVLLSLLSSSGSYMTALAGQPYIISAETFTDESSGRKATLMLASPLSDDFLQFSQGFAASDNIIALMYGSPLRVIATNKPDILRDGSTLADLEGHFLVMGKSFFDYGASDIQLQFTSLISNEEYANTNKSILTAERRMLTISALVFVLVMTATMLWITRQLHGLTVLISNFSKKTLHVEITDRTEGDELLVLKKYFQRLTTEIDVSQQALIAETMQLEEAQEELKTINAEVVAHREMLQRALDEITRLIEAVATRHAFDVRFQNPNLEKCYEVMECPQEECPCHGQPPARCWQISGTYCMGTPLTGKFVNEVKDCTYCKVYKLATKDPIYMIGECFNNMMNILEQQHLELDEAYKGLKATQSQMLQHEKMASVGQIAAGVAHEINNPTGFIISNLGTLKKYMEKIIEFTQFSEESLASGEAGNIEAAIQAKKKQLKIDYIMTDLSNLVQETLEGAERIKTIVQNLKTFSRLDEVGRKMGDINAGIESTLNILANEIKYKAVVKKDLGEIPLTLCNLGQLNQVFMNIIINAAHSIEEKGEIAISTREENGFIVITFSDTGRGIPPEILARIFEPFFTTKDPGQGTGLGLSIAYDIVQEHHGEIAAESEVGKGTTFTIRIPIEGG